MSQEMPFKMCLGYKKKSSNDGDSSIKGETIASTESHNSFLPTVKIRFNVARFQPFQSKRMHMSINSQMRFSNTACMYLHPSLEKPVFKNPLRFQLMLLKVLSDHSAKPAVDTRTVYMVCVQWMNHSGIVPAVVFFI